MSIEHDSLLFEQYPRYTDISCFVDWCGGWWMVDGLAEKAPDVNTFSVDDDG